MRKNKWAVVCALALLCAMLGGCQFARDEQELSADEFVGISLRLENWGKPTGTDEYGNVTYGNAPVEETELTEDQIEAMLRGEPIPYAPQEYPLERYSTYVLRYTDEYGESVGITRTEWPGDAQAHISVTDEGESYSIDATVYVTGPAFRQEGDELVILNIDSVYCRPDGTLYTLREGGGMSGMLDGFSREIEQTSSVTDSEGKTMTRTVRCKVSVHYTPELREAVVFAYDGNGALISKSSLDITGIDYTIAYAVPPDAAYLVLETTGIHIEGTIESSRSLRDLPVMSEEALFCVYIPDGDGFAVPVAVMAE